MPESQVFYADGSAVPLEKADQEIAAGKAFAKKGERVAMLDSTGAPVTVASGDLRQAIESGFSVEDPAAGEMRRVKRERGTLGEQALTAVEGAARGVSLGTSDALAGAVLGDEYSTRARQRQEVNPLTAGGSEILGGIGAAVASGGTGALARGAAFTPAGLTARAGAAAERLVGRGATALGLGEGTLARMATRAAQVGASGATEGALYGAGSEISKAALENTDLTAEKLLSGAYREAKFGGLLGAGMGAGGVAASKAAERLMGGTSLQERARRLASKSALDAVGFQGTDYRKLTGRKVGQAAEDRIDQVGQDLLEYRFKEGPLKGQKLFTGAKKAEDYVDDLTFAREETGNAIGQQRAKADRFIKASPELAEDLGASTRDYLKRVDDEILQPLKSSLSPTAQRQAKRVETELAQIRERVEAPPAMVRMNGTTELRPRQPLTFSELEDFRKRMGDIVYPQRPAGGGLAPPPPAHAVHLQKAERMLTDMMDDKIAKAFASAGEDASKFKELKRQFSSIKDVEAVANKAAGQQRGNRSVSPSDYAVGLGTAISMLASGNVAGLALGGASAIAHKLLRERGRSVIAQMAQHVATLDDEAVGAIRKIAGEVGKAPRRAIQSAEAIDRRYDDLSSSVEKYQSDPKHAQEVLASNVEQIAGRYPELAAAVQNKIQGDYQYLAQQMPGRLSRADASLTPEASAKMARVPHAAKAKIVNIATALERPNSILTDLANGRVPREKIEAIKARRPEIFAEMRTMVMKHVATQEEEIPYLERVQLSLAFDFSGDKSLAPKAIASIQADNSTPPSEDQKNPPGGVSSLNPQQAQEGASLPSQRAEA